NPEVVLQEVGNLVLHSKRLRSSYPAVSTRPVFPSRKQLKRTDQETEYSHASEQRAQTSPRAGPGPQVIQQQRRERQQREDRRLMVPAQQGESDGRSTQRSIRKRSASPAPVHHAVKEKKDQRDPHRAVEHLRPRHISQIAPKGKSGPGHDGGKPAR